MRIPSLVGGAWGPPHEAPLFIVTPKIRFSVITSKVFELQQFWAHRWNPRVEMHLFIKFPERSDQYWRTALHGDFVSQLWQLRISFPHTSDFSSALISSKCTILRSFRQSAPQLSIFSKSGPLKITTFDHNVGIIGATQILIEALSPSCWSWPYCALWSECSKMRPYSHR